MLSGQAAFADRLAPGRPAATIACATTPTQAPVVLATSGSAAGTYAGVLLTGAQVDAANTVVNVGLDQGITRRGIAIAIAAAMQASSLRPTAAKLAYVGLFQQRSDATSQLYTKLDRSDSVGASRMFFDQLVARVPGYDTDPRSDAEVADAVQESGDVTLITNWLPMAQALTDTLVPAPTPAPTPEPTPVEPAATTETAIVPIYALANPLPLRGSGIAFRADPTGTDAPSTTSPTTDPVAAPDAVTTDPTTTTDAVSTSDISPDPATGTEGSTTDGTTTTADTTTDTTTAEPSTDPTPTDVTPTDITPTTSDSTATTTATPTATTTATPTPTTTATPAPTTTEPLPVLTTEPPAPEPAQPNDDPAVVDTPAPAPSTAADPNLGPDTVGRPYSGAVLDCAPNNNGGSTTWDPGFIISDEIFYNTAAMTADQIQAFVDAQGAACQGSYCVKDLRVTTPDVPADQYCAAYTGGTDESAAAVLAKVSLACGVNPQVMLVTLQKESALLTRTSPSAASYAAAWGWHCPDSGPGGSANCDPRYAGFFNQAYGMAKQWSRYKVDPGKYHYQAGQTAEVLWNVAESGCGGSTVTIRNTATASLYNYTPYQPNQAALASYPGTGDACSAYGNRNFFFLFQKYFGVTGGGLASSIAVNGVQVSIPDSPYVPEALRGATVNAPSEAVARGIAAGLASIGLPYVWGGGTNGGQADQGCSRGGGSLNSCAGTVGFDCSGLTAYVLTQAGFAIGTNSGSQRAGGQSVPWQPGIAG